MEESYLHFIPEELLGVIVKSSSDTEIIIKLVEAYPELTDRMIRQSLLSYLLYIPDELLGLIIKNDINTETVIKWIEAYPELTDRMIRQSLLSEYKLYTYIKEINKYTGLNLDNIVKTLFIHITTEYDTSDDYDIIRKYKEFTNDAPLLYHEYLDKIEKRDKILYTILIHLFYVAKYPSILEYYYKHLDRFNNVTLRGLYESLILLLIEEYHLLNSYVIDQDTTIDLLKLWEKDTEDEISSLSITQDRIDELIESEEYSRLAKFLLDKGIQIV